MLSGKEDGLKLTPSGLDRFHAQIEQWKAIRGMGRHIAGGCNTVELKSTQFAMRSPIKGLRT
jgi:hypothetical protein